MLMDSTTISSISVKPRSPVFVLRAIQCRSLERREDVEYILPAPGLRVGPVLIRPHAPLRALGHRVSRNPPQKPELPARRVVRGGGAIYKLLQVGRIVF